MKKAFTIVLKVILCLLLVSPILGVLGVFPPPTPDMYTTLKAYNFIATLFAAKYIMYIQAIVFAASAILIAINRTALAALLLIPITVNIIGFHAFLDGGLFTGGAVMADVLFILNVYFLWQNRATYAVLWQKQSAK